MCFTEYKEGVVDLITLGTPKEISCKPVVVLYIDINKEKGIEFYKKLLDKFSCEGGSYVRFTITCLEEMQAACELAMYSKIFDISCSLEINTYLQSTMKDLNRYFNKIIYNVPSHICKELGNANVFYTRMVGFDKHCKNIEFYINIKLVDVADIVWLPKTFKVFGQLKNLKGIFVTSEYLNLTEAHRKGLVAAFNSIIKLTDNKTIDMCPISIKSEYGRYIQFLETDIFSPHNFTNCDIMEQALFINTDGNIVAGCPNLRKLTLEKTLPIDFSKPLYEHREEVNNLPIPKSVCDKACSYYDIMACSISTKEDTEK